MDYHFQEQHGFLPVDGRNLRVSCFLPTAGHHRTCLVIASPFGEEKRGSARMEVRLARQLAALEIPAATCDLSGTGDSQSVPGGASWNDWQNELLAICRELQSLAGADSISLLGLRAGGLLAATTALLLRDQLSALLLTEPLLGGREMLAELERRERLKETSHPAAPHPAATAREFAGQPLSATMAAALQNIELLPCLQHLNPACRLQLLRVSGLTRLPPAWQPLDELCRQRAASELLLVRDKPFWGQTDYFESDLVLQEIRRFLTSPC